MRRALLALTAAGVLAAQTVDGPVLAYVVDASSWLRPIYGLPSAAHIGGPLREGVRDAWGPLTLFQDGSALVGNTKLEGHWDSVQPGSLADASGRTLLILGRAAAPWRLDLPERALAARVSASGDQVLTLLADDSVALWRRGGKAEWRIAASPWWAIAFAGERPVAYDPAAHSLYWLDGGSTSLLRKLTGDGSRYALAVNATGTHAALLGETGFLVRLADGEQRSFPVPEGGHRLETVDGGRTFLLSHDPATPLWIIDPVREEPLLVIPALASEPSGVR